MVGTYADKYGNNPCRPDGIHPDIELQDNPLDGFALGDEDETMLHAALMLAAGEAPDAVTTRASCMVEFPRIDVARPSYFIQKTSILK